MHKSRKRDIRKEAGVWPRFRNPQADPQMPWVFVPMQSPLDVFEADLTLTVGNLDREQLPPV